MQLLRPRTPYTPAELKARMRSASTASEFRRWQVLYISSVSRVTASYLADITGYSKANIYSIVQQSGKEEKKGQRGGRKRQLMDPATERAMMRGFEEMAVQGRVMKSSDIKQIVEAKLGKAVSDDYIWDLFRRNGWKKHLPAPNQYNNRQTDPKKPPKTIWLPLKIILQNIQQRQDLVK